MAQSPVQLAVGRGLTLGLLAACTAAGAEPCAVDHCHDGDTCTLVCGRHTDTPRRVKVRLHCVDAPELAQAPWGRWSAEALRWYAPAGTVVDLEAVTRDRYGRTVGVLHARGVRVNVEMVRQGFATVYEKYCAEPAYYQARDEAKAAGRGIWAVPGQQQRPWEWRHRGAGFIPLPKQQPLNPTLPPHTYFDFRYRGGIISRGRVSPAACLGWFLPSAGPEPRDEWRCRGRPSYFQPAS
jgi:endonuclease YncB( thermonuclease family)